MLFVYLIAGWFVLALIAERITRTPEPKRKDQPRRGNGQYKRRVPIREYGEVTSYIYL